jgi:signal transduction histidine kinase
MTPLENVRADTLSCMWDTPQYFFFSAEVERMIYYTHFLPAIATIFLATFLVLSRQKSLQTILLITISFLFITYALLDVLLWAISDPSQIMFFWSLTNYIEPLIYVAVFYLVASFAYKKDISLGLKFALGLLLAPIIFLGPTSLNLAAYDYSNCDRLAIEGPLVLYIYLLEVIIAIWMFLYGMLAYHRAHVQGNKKSILYLTIGSLFFLFAFSFGNIFGTLFQEVLGEEAWAIGQYGFFGMPVFLGFITYLIVRFEAFNTKLLGAQALVLTLWVLIGSLLFIVQSTASRVVASATLILAVVFGIFLVRSVKHTVKQKEEIEKLAANLKVANEQLKVLDRMKSEFVSIASHQLRSPLTSIRGYASMLAEGSYGKLTAKAQEVAERIAESSKYMALSVEDYLNVSRIEAGNMKYEMSDFNLKDVAEKIVDELRPVGIKKGLVMVFRSQCAGSCSVHADIGKTRQILMNLLDNSMKYTPKGSITVVAHDDPVKKRMYVTIHDTGVGMSTETKEEVFEKFVRAKNANNVNVTGTGLGLYVAKKMLTDMGGKVTAESEGEGSSNSHSSPAPQNINSPYPFVAQNKTRRETGFVSCVAG